MSVKLSLVVEQEHVTIFDPKYDNGLGKTKGKDRFFVIRDMDGDDRSAYKEALSSGFDVAIVNNKPQIKKAPSGKGTTDADIILLSLCLYECSDEKGSEVHEDPVPLAEIRKWRYQVIEALVLIAKKLNKIKIDEEEGKETNPKEEAKNV